MTATGTVYAPQLDAFAILDGLVQVAISHRVHSTADHTVSVRMERALVGMASLAAVVNGILQHFLIVQHAPLSGRFSVRAPHHA